MADNTESAAALMLSCCEVLAVAGDALACSQESQEPLEAPGYLGP
ncbi:MAG: hypothetical protein ACLFTT_15220 [Candidatus Hydrogenedentota bacterium]